MSALVLGRNLPYAEYGSGPPVLLVHGLGGAGTFDRAVPLLSPAFRLLVPDLFSDARSHPFSVAAWAELLGDFLTAVHAAPAAVVGHSLGGMITQVLAADRPGQVRCLMLAGTYVSTAPERLPALAARADAARSRGMAAVVDMTMAFLYGHRGEGATPAMVDPYRRSLAAADPEAYAQACDDLAAFSTQAYLPRISCPVLMVTGDRDTASSPALNAQIQRTVTGAQLELLPGCSHLSPLEEPERFAALLARFAAPGG